MNQYQNALISSCWTFNSSDIYSNPEISDIQYSQEAFYALKNKARAFRDLYRQKTRREEDLLASMNAYDLTLRIIYLNRISFPQFESKVWLSGAEKETFDGAVATAHELYALTGRPEYGEKLFEFAEQGKAAALLASMREREAMEKGGISSTMLGKENDLASKIDRLQSDLREEVRLRGKNTVRAAQLDDELFELRNEQDRLIADLEKKYPVYYRLKYDDKIASVSQVRERLNENQVFVEYTTTDKDIYIFAITRHDYKVYQLPRPSDFDSLTTNLRKYLDELGFINQSPEFYASYLDAAHRLYTLLLEPAGALIAGKELIIVPDDRLSTIPFEVLLTRKATVDTEYGYLPYLIVSNPVGYAYSGNLLYFHSSPAPMRRLSLAAFSPSYADIGDIDENSPNRKYRDFLKPLPFAKEEARNISRIFGGDVYKDKDACESRFKKVAPRYDVLHLSMHAMVDDQNPMYSNLAFGMDRSADEDGYLNTFELFNMKLNARMAVLSACNTGVGALQKGEGIMSLARGFYYAGCPDVVMTLWPVEDQLSSDLVTKFYQHLAQGKTKAEALREAKLSFLRSADPLRAHPYFWAGYVNIGDNTPLVEQHKERSPGAAIAWAGLLGLLIVLLPLTWRFLL